MKFKVLKEDNRLFRCSNCGEHDFIKLNISSADPPAYRKFQVLITKFTCSKCGTVNGIKHTKLKGFLMDQIENDIMFKKGE